MEEQEIFFYDHGFSWSPFARLGIQQEYNTFTVATTKENALLLFVDFIKRQSLFLHIQKAEPKLENGNIYIKIKFLTICTTTQNMLNAINNVSFLNCEVINIVDEWIKVCSEQEYRSRKFDK